jgi:hypothetical protein
VALRTPVTKRGCEEGQQQPVLRDGPGWEMGSRQRAGGKEGQRCSSRGRHQMHQGQRLQIPRYRLAHHQEPPSTQARIHGATAAVWCSGTVAGISTEALTKYPQSCTPASRLLQAIPTRPFWRLGEQTNVRYARAASRLAEITVQNTCWISKLLRVPPK